MFPVGPSRQRQRGRGFVPVPPAAMFINLQAGLTAWRGVGSPTFSRATAATVWGFAAGANGGASPISTPTKIAMTYGGTVANGYVNGVLTAQSPVTTANPALVLAGSKLSIGEPRDAGPLGSELFGTIRNVKIFQQVLSRAQIASL